MRVQLRDDKIGLCMRMRSSSQPCSASTVWINPHTGISLTGLLGFELAQHHHTQSAVFIHGRYGSFIDIQGRPSLPSTLTPQRHCFYGYLIRRSVGPSLVVDRGRGRGSGRRCLQVAVFPCLELNVLLTSALDATRCVVGIGQKGRDERV